MPGRCLYPSRNLSDKITLFGGRIVLGKREGRTNPIAALSVTDSWSKGDQYLSHTLSVETPVLVLTVLSTICRHLASFPFTFFRHSPLLLGLYPSHLRIGNPADRRCGAARPLPEALTGQFSLILASSLATSTCLTSSSQGSKPDREAFCSWVGLWCLSGDSGCLFGAGCSRQERGGSADSPGNDGVNISSALSSFVVFYVADSVEESFHHLVVAAAG